MAFIRDIFGFLKERKKWWLVPLIIVLLLVGAVIVIGAMAPLLYTLF